jgi:hypothetical protein
MYFTKTYVVPRSEKYPVTLSEKTASCYLSGCIMMCAGIRLLNAFPVPVTSPGLRFPEFRSFVP